LKPSPKKPPRRANGATHAAPARPAATAAQLSAVPRPAIPRHDFDVAPMPPVPALSASATLDNVLYGAFHNLSLSAKGTHAVDPHAVTQTAEIVARMALQRLAFDVPADAVFQALSDLGCTTTLAGLEQRLRLLDSDRMGRLTAEQRRNDADRHHRVGFGDSSSNKNISGNSDHSGEDTRDQA
jgi:hypothetical protein